MRKELKRDPKTGRFTKATVQRLRDAKTGRFVKTSAK